jgi:hypothetical protein
VSPELLAVLIVAPTIAVVLALFWVLWNGRASARQSWVAIVSFVVLAAWALTVSVLARRGFFLPPDEKSPPPMGIHLGIVLVGLGILLAFSANLRSLLTNQKYLIWLNVWRLVGLVFLGLMATGQMPALWALPAGIGDVIVGVMAPWVASQLDKPAGKRIAIVFNLFGLADLVVAVGLGIMTSPGPLRVFDTTPTSEFVTHFPLALVPAFLVPLAFALHIVSLWQLLGKPWQLLGKPWTQQPNAGM